MTSVHDDVAAPRGHERSPRRPPVGRGGLAAAVRGLAQVARRGRRPADGQPAPGRRLARPGPRHRRPGPGGRGHRPHPADVDELARARRAGDTAAVLPGRRAERRRRLAEPDLEFRAFCARRGLPPSQPCNWSGPGTHGRPSGTGAARSASGRATPTPRSGHADHPPASRKLDTIAVLTARLLFVPLSVSGVQVRSSIPISGVPAGQRLAPTACGRRVVNFRSPNTSF